MYIVVVHVFHEIPYSWFLLRGLNSCARAETQKLDLHKLIT